MPNWCSNTLTLTHSDPAMITKATMGLIEGGLLEAFIPTPQDLKDTIAGSFGAGTPEQAALEEKEKSNLLKYGYKNWYDFHVAEWGTKWDIGGSDCSILETSDTSVSANFDSAWGPPIEAYHKLEDMGFTVEATYNEFGMGFCGIWKNGSDDYYEYSQMDKDEIRDTIPQRLQDEYGISDTLDAYGME